LPFRLALCMSFGLLNMGKFLDREMNPWENKNHRLSEVITSMLALEDILEENSLGG
jgi:hypothetical protein